MKSQFQVRFVSKHIVYISISIYSQLWKAKKGMWVHSSPKLIVMSQFERGWGVGWSEKHKNWKMQKYQADSEPRHSTDFRTIFVIMIGCFVSCEIGQT